MNVRVFQPDIKFLTCINHHICGFMLFYVTLTTILTWSLL